MTRMLSHSEVASLLDCQAAHDFRYVGQLAGSALKPKAVAPQLREGRAWGAGVAAYHALDDPIAALRKSLDEDAEQQREAGLYMPDEHAEMLIRLTAMLEHYIGGNERIPIDRLEHELLVPIPSRMGKRRSTVYRFLAKLDGVHVDPDGRTWIIEFKLRKQLSSLEQVVLSRQTRWYAWAWRELTGTTPSGVIVDERLNEIPKEPRLVKAKRKGEGLHGVVPSHAKDQVTTPKHYQALCAEYGVEPDPETSAALAARTWSARHPVIFRPRELDEAGWQMVSVARLLRDLDSGELYPVRNPSRARCPGCAFREICATPDDQELVDALYRRVPSKRDRPEELPHAA